MKIYTFVIFQSVVRNRTTVRTENGKTVLAGSEQQHKELIKMKILAKMAASFVALGLLLGTTAAVSAAPFGKPADVRFAKKLWKKLAAALLVGPHRINVRPFEGNEPHGAIQQVLGTKIRVMGHKGKVRVKANHYGKGASVASVYDNPNEYLKAYTVMFRMKKGYDPENRDWFWAKYNVKGKLMTNPKGVKLAGRVAKGAKKGCIFCHKASGGEDLETLTEK